MEKVRLKIGGMGCQGCSMAVGGALRRVPGVKSAEVDLAGASAIVEYDEAQTGLEQLIAAVQQSGYTATLAKAA
jgi:copper chaperone